MNKQKKIVIFIIFIIILIFVGIGIAPYINTKTTPPINPVLGDNRYRVDPNALPYEGNIKSVQSGGVFLDSDGRQLNIDVPSRVSVFNVSNSNKNDVLQIGNTVVIRFSVDNNAINKAVSISKIDLGRIDNNSVLLNGDVDQQLFDVIGQVVEVNGNSFSIDTNIKNQKLTFDINNPNFLVATISDISNITPQSHAKIWAREMGPRFRAILIVIYIIVLFLS